MQTELTNKECYEKHKHLCRMLAQPRWKHNGIGHKLRMKNTPTHPKLKSSQENLPVSQSHHKRMMIFLDARDRIPKISPQSPQLLAPLVPLITIEEIDQILTT
jgi:hypothetical protein